MMSLFGRTPTRDPAATARLKAWAREIFGADDKAVVAVAELRCAEADCPDVETVVAVLSRGGSRKIKVPKPLGDVTRDDLAAAPEETA